MPMLMGTLVGRRQEAEALSQTLRQPGTRLVTLTGTGGVGKTRLALHLLDILSGEFDDVAFVPLSAVTTPSQVFTAIGQVFRLIADVADGYDDQLIELLQGRRLLIVLDNCEQIPDGHLPVGRLLTSCPRMTILATSQAPVGVEGEQLFPLSPLPTPCGGEVDVEAIQRADAVELFAARARTVNPYFMVDSANATEIASICRELQGLPLAIELAAARSNVLSPAALLARLGQQLDVLGSGWTDAPDRLRTMRRAIRWSYELLAPEEQRLFQSLAVFEEHFSLESVEAIFDASSTDRAAIDVLAALVDRNLVRRSTRDSHTERYFILNVLRLFGREQLEAEGKEQAARLAHAEVMAQLAEDAEPHLVMPDQGRWLDRLDDERGNLRAAIAWALAHGREDIVFRIAGSIWRYCASRGLITECREWLAKALPAQGAHLTQHRTRALIGAGYLAEDQRDLDAAHRLFTQARHLAAAIGDTTNECRALIGLGTVAHDRSDYEPALQLHHEALTLARSVGDTRSIAVTLANLGSVSYFLGKPEDALRYWEESRISMAAIGDRISEAISLMNLGALSSQTGDYVAAERYQNRALALQREMNVQRDIPFTLMNLSEAALELGDLTLAHDTISEAIAMLRELGSNELLAMAYTGRARIALVEGNLPEASSFVLEAIPLLDEVENQVPIIEAIELMAEICSAHGMHGEALEFIEATRAERERTSIALYEARRQKLEQAEARAHAALPQAEIDSAVSSGRAQSPASLSRRAMSLAREIVGRRLPGRTSPAIEVADLPNLTAREAEVLTLLVQGRSTQQIADELFVSPRTAATHINNILGKLHVNSRTAAVAYAMRAGLV
jgi:predicted ATPase/DNA-binding NarL/FixJ family response regulator/Tfp pilus assembly protein PilF